MNYAGKVFHIRRCHVCDTVNEGQNKFLLKCQDCGKHFAPFFYYDEGHQIQIRDDGAHTSVWSLIEGYHPLWGISTYWEELAS